MLFVFNRFSCPPWWRGWWLGRGSLLSAPRLQRSAASQGPARSCTFWVFYRSQSYVKSAFKPCCRHNERRKRENYCKDLRPSSCPRPRGRTSQVVEASQSGLEYYCWLMFIFDFDLVLKPLVGKKRLTLLQIIANWVTSCGAEWQNAWELNSRNNLFSFFKYVQVVPVWPRRAFWGWEVGTFWSTLDFRGCTWFWIIKKKT